MSMQYFILKDDISGAELQIIDKTVLHQMKDVLRFKKGDECVVLDGFGMKANGRIEELHKKGAVITLIDHELCKAPSRRLRIYCAISKKPSTFELIVQKATEIGVTDIIPLVSSRCQVKELRKVERLAMIIREACEQSERAFIPKLHDVLMWKDFSENAPSGELLAGDPRDTDGKLSDMQNMPQLDCNLVIGPEGGFTDDELADIRKMGGRVFLLGETILRMETAAIAALSVVQFG